MLTRCPHCQTHFRVTAEQLKIRQGKVRCGACQEVFDALDSLSDEALVAPAAPLLPETETRRSQDGTGEVRETLATIVTVESIPAAANEIIEAQPEAEEEPEPQPEPEQQPEVESEPTPEPAPAPLDETEPVAEAEVPPEAEPEPEPDSEPEPEPESAPEPESEPTPESDSPDQPTSEAASPAAEENWEPVPAVPAPSRRWLKLIGIIALLIAAAGQLTYIFRTELAVVAPELRPALVASCELFGCTLPRPLKPELVGIETSDLVPDGDGLLLTATLMNRAPFEQDFPHLELTLTDTQDEALVRKVLLPADYLPAGQDPSQGFAARGEVSVKLALTTDNVPAVGYRLYLFYP
jgi:predicted Zn finger-like uncharacterized protein